MLTEHEATIKLTVPARVRDTATNWALSGLNEVPGGCPEVRGTSVAAHDRQAALMASLLPVAATVSVTFSSVSRSDRRCRWPLTRRNCLPASTIPAAHQRSAICPSRQRFTLLA